MRLLPPSSFTFKMAFGNGTALMLKPEWRKMKIHYCNDIKKLCAYVWTAHVRRDESQLLGMLAGLPFNEIEKMAKTNLTLKKGEKSTSSFGFPRIFGVPFQTTSW